MHNRVTAIALVLLLATLLGWCLTQNVGPLWVRLSLVGGIVSGTVYAIRGRIPNWLLLVSDGRITDGKDPANISPAVYLPVLLTVIVIAVMLLAVALTP